MSENPTPELADTHPISCPYCDMAAWLVMHGNTELGSAVAHALETELLANAAKLDGARGQQPELLEANPAARAEAQHAVFNINQVIGYVNSPLALSISNRFPTLTS